MYYSFLAHTQNGVILKLNNFVVCRYINNILVREQNRDENTSFMRIYRSY